MQSVHISVNLLEEEIELIRKWSANQYYFTDHAYGSTANNLVGMGIIYEDPERPNWFMLTFAGLQAREYIRKNL